MLLFDMSLLRHAPHLVHIAMLRREWDRYWGPLMMLHYPWQFRARTQVGLFLQHHLSQPLAEWFAPMPAMLRSGHAVTTRTHVLSTYSQQSHAHRSLTTTLSIHCYPLCNRRHPWMTWLGEINPPSLLITDDHLPSLLSAATIYTALAYKVWSNVTTHVWCQNCTDGIVPSKHQHSWKAKSESSGIEHCWSVIILNIWTIMFYPSSYPKLIRAPNNTYI